MLVMKKTKTNALEHPCKKCLLSVTLSHTRACTKCCVEIVLPYLLTIYLHTLDPCLHLLLRSFRHSLDHFVPRRSAQSVLEFAPFSWIFSFATLYRHLLRCLSPPNSSSTVRFACYTAHLMPWVSPQRRSTKLDHDLRNKNLI